MARTAYSGLALMVLAVTYLFVPFSAYASTCDSTSIVSDTSTIASVGSTEAVSPVSSYWTANIPGATWIWSTAPEYTNESDQVVTFTRTFTLHSVQNSATLLISADDLFDVSVNGTEVGSNSEADPFMKVFTYNVANLLTTGTNTITVKVTNLVFDGSYNAAQNPGGLLYSLSMQPECNAVSGGNSGGGNSGVAGQRIITTNIAPVSETNGGNVLPLGDATSGGSDTSGPITPSNTASSSGATNLASISASTTPIVGTTTLAAAVGLFGNLPLYVWFAILLLIIALLIVARELYRRNNQ